MFQGHAQGCTHRALSILVFTVTLLLTFACPWDQRGLVFAQGMPPAGSFGVLLNEWQAGGSAGTAILGVVNFDGGGNVTGTYTVEIGGQPAQTLTGTLTGTYSSKPDGTGTLRVTLDVGVTFSYAMAITDGGQGLQLVETACTGCGGGGSRGNGGGGNGEGGGSGPSPISLQGTAQSLTGSLPAGFFTDNATGSMQVAMQGANGPGPNGGETIYTVTSGTGSGTVPNCPNGQGNWSASQKTLTIVVSPPVSSFGANGGSVSGTYISAIAVIFCGGSAASTTYFLSSGSVSGTVSPQGNANLILGGNGGGGNGGSGGGGGGSVTSGTARAISTAPPSGSYGFQLNKSPSAEGVVGIMNFDGSANVTGSFTDISGSDSNQPSVTGTFTGTYSANPDGSGVINIGVVEGGQSENIKFAVVPTDGGSGILLLQTSGTENSVLFGSGRLQ